MTHNATHHHHHSPFVKRLTYAIAAAPLIGRIGAGVIALGVAGYALNNSFQVAHGPSSVTFFLGEDKLLHFCGYASLALFTCQATRPHNRRYIVFILPAVWFAVAGYGWVNELLQEMSNPGTHLRDSDPFDELANIAGSLTGCVLFGWALSVVYEEHDAALHHPHHKPTMAQKVLHLHVRMRATPEGTRIQEAGEHHASH